VPHDVGNVNKGQVQRKCRIVAQNLAEVHAVLAPVPSMSASRKMQLVFTSFCSACVVCDCAYSAVHCPARALR
jgi:hypothetical protein